MKYIQAAAKAFAEMQWAQTFPKEDICLHHPYWKEPTKELEEQKDEWISARTVVWVHRMHQIRGYASAAETAACAWSIFLILLLSNPHSVDGMDSLYFSHWFDLFAIPLLVALDRVRIYLIQDTGKAAPFLTTLFMRMACIMTGILFGFLSPLLLVFSVILLLSAYHHFRRVKWILSCF